MAQGNSISDVMIQQHRDCDDLFADAEAAVADKQWQEARQKADEFIRSMQHHLRMEEEILFPAFEEQTNHMPGPTQVMLMEHEQMRELFQELLEQAENQDVDNFLGVSETLMTLMQQHNIKEEQILYAMMDDTLADKKEQLLQRVTNSDS